jgi:hypothetical protein
MGYKRRIRVSTLDGSILELITWLYFMPSRRENIKYSFLNVNIKRVYKKKGIK